jgi:cupin 2 domain-containing protein
MKNKNIFSKIPKKSTKEIFTSLLKNKNIKIERIISYGQTSPKKFWYDQNKNEWVILLKGNAKILFKGRTKAIKLLPGDYINIPAHKKHKVEHTAKNKPTIWLAIHY